MGDQSSSRRLRLLDEAMYVGAILLGGGRAHSVPDAPLSASAAGAALRTSSWHGGTQREALVMRVNARAGTREGHVASAVVAAGGAVTGDAALLRAIGHDSAAESDIKAPESAAKGAAIAAVDHHYEGVRDFDKGYSRVVRSMWPASACIVVEPNCRLFLFNQARLVVRLVKCLSTVHYVLPHMIVAHIDQDTIARAINRHGMRCYQILAFLDSRSAACCCWAAAAAATLVSVWT